MMEVFGHPGHIALWADAHAGQPVDWDALFEGYQATVDWPSCNLWREQAAHFTDARVLLSRRDPEKWYASVMNTIYPSSRAAAESDDPGQRQFGLWAMEIIWKGVFDDRMDDKAHVIDVYERHNQSVIHEVPAERLLVFEPGDGWAPLCQFLGVDVPDTDYPHVNTTEEFRQR